MPDICNFVRYCFCEISERIIPRSDRNYPPDRRFPDFQIQNFWQNTTIDQRGFATSWSTNNRYISVFQQLKYYLVTLLIPSEEQIAIPVSYTHLTLPTKRIV